jgi:F0F1-type ATP synthase assembly protein I
MAVGDNNPNDDQPKKGGAMHGMVQAESMVQLALVIPIGCCLGWFGGAALDKHFGTSWIAIVGFLLGATGGFIQIIRFATAPPRKGS